MKKVLSICFMLSVLISCKNTIETKESLIMTVKLLDNQLHEADSMKKVLIKETFAAGYRQGVSTGINNSSASISALYQMVSGDSLKFAKFVDISFK